MTGIIENNGKFISLSGADIANLGRYLFGSSWQTALSRRLKISRRSIVYWKSSKRPINAKYSAAITQIVGWQHRRRVNREQATYTAMIESISSASARALLLSMLAEEVAIRVAAINELSRGFALETHHNGSALTAEMARQIGA